MLTRGQMAVTVNQHGYDVVGADGERISVKTVTTSGRAAFNPRTLAEVDRIMVFQIRADGDAGVSIETLLDVRRGEFGLHLRELANGEVDFPVRPQRDQARPLEEQVVVAEGVLDDWTVRQYESGSIAVLDNGTPVPVAKPALRALAARLGVDLRNGAGGMKNTRQLGAGVIDAMIGLG